MPYPQPNTATGICFGNKEGTVNISPSLEVIRDSCINPDIPHGPIEFDITLESWAKQGILMLNSALTCEVGKTDSHSMLWRPFIAKLIRNLSEHETGLIYVLFGSKAQTFKPYIDKNNDIIEIEHPAYFARLNRNMPSDVFTDINKLLTDRYGTPIEWYKELNNLNNYYNEKEKDYSDDFFWPCSL